MKTVKYLLVLGSSIAILVGCASDHPNSGAMGNGSDYGTSNQNNSNPNGMNNNGTPNNHETAPNGPNGVTSPSNPMGSGSGSGIEQAH